MRIVYIDIDSLRADHLGAYGYHRNTSPVIDEIARDGLVMEQVYTSDAPCLPSRTALYSARFGIQNGVVGHGGTAAQPKLEGPERDFAGYFGQQDLAAQLKKQGLRTTIISPFIERHSAHWLAAAFNQVVNTGRNGMESAEEIMPHVKKWLEENQEDDNWFLHVNLWDPHTPYRVPESYGEPFANDPMPAWLDDEELIERHRKLTGIHTISKINHDVKNFPRQPHTIDSIEGLRRLINGYDTGIRYADDAIGEILASLKEAGVYDDTMIIITGDHGENFGELGLYAEHATADEGTTHVPMVIKYPGGVQGVRDKGLHYQLDLAPTLIELLGGTPPKLWDGKSFAQTILTGEEKGREQLVIGQCAHVAQRSVRWDGENGEKFLYIRTYHNGFYNALKEEMLFDLNADPHETHNLADEQPDLCLEGRARLAYWHDEQMQKMARTSSDIADPLWTVIKEGGPAHGGFSKGARDVENFEHYLKQLRATGRSEGAEELEARYRSDMDRAVGKPPSGPGF